MPLNKYATFHLSILLLTGIWVVSVWGLVWTVLPRTTLNTSPGEHMYAFLLGLKPWMQLVSVWSTLTGMPNSIPKWLYQFSHTRSGWKAALIHTLDNTIVMLLLVCNTVVLICFSLMINAVHHFLMFTGHLDILFEVWYSNCFPIFPTGLCLCFSH